jgi:hypothetical protein
MLLKGNNLYINLDYEILYPRLSYISSISCRGCLWKGADQNVRRCYPVLLAFQVDYPEACMLTLVRQNHACPTCIARKNKFNNLQIKHLECTVQDMMKIFYHAWDLEINGDNKRVEEKLQDNGLVNIKV